MVKSVVVRFSVMVLALSLGGIVAFVAGYGVVGGWLQPWVPVAAPPEEIAAIRMINASEIWIETTSGATYYNSAADACDSECWVMVAEVPAEPEPPPGVESVAARTCVWAPPLLGAVERDEECQRSTWQEVSTVYARRRSGELFIWQDSIDLEYSGVLVCLWGIAGGLVSFMVAWLVLLMQLVLRKRLRLTGVRSRA